MLSIKPMSGYDIKKLIETSISNFWTESYGQIYPMLKTLVAEKLVTRTDGEAEGKTGSPRLRRLPMPAWMSCAIGSLVTPTPQVGRNELLLKLFFGEDIPWFRCQPCPHRRIPSAPARRTASEIPCDREED